MHKYTTLLLLKPYWTISGRAAIMAICLLNGLAICLSGNFDSEDCPLQYIPVVPKLCVEDARGGTRKRNEPAADTIVQKIPKTLKCQCYLALEVAFFPAKTCRASPRYKLVSTFSNRTVRSASRCVLYMETVIIQICIYVYICIHDIYVIIHKYMYVYICVHTWNRDNTQ